MRSLHYSFLVFCALVCHLCQQSLTKAESDKIFTVKDCRNKAKNVDDLVSYNAFARYLSQYVNQNNALENLEANINRCLHSSNGIEDWLGLNEIVEQLPNVHSVCEPDFIDRLIEFADLMTEHVSYSRIFKRKRTNRLLRFFRMLAGQVVLTCKTSLERKLITAENENKQLELAVKRITKTLEETATKREEKVQSVLKSANLSPIFALALKLRPNMLQQAENLVLANTMLHSSDGIEFSMDITLNSQHALENFIQTKQACKLIDKYAQSSIYPITRLAWKGYMARNELGAIDKKLKDSEKVQDWIKVVQYCQGILVTKAYLDLDQNVPVKLVRELANDEQIILLDVVKQNGQNCVQDEKQTKDSSISMPIVCGLDWHRFEHMRETFDKFDEKLSCYTFPNSLNGWLEKRMGKNERLMSKFIKLRYNEYHNGNDPEKDVKFGGAMTGVGNGGYAVFSGHAVAHGAFKFRPTGARRSSAANHHYYVFFGAHLPGWAGWLSLFGCLLVVAILAGILEAWLDI